MSINKVVDNGYCVGCGACSLVDKDSVTMQFNDNGFYEAKVISDLSPIANKVCPFSLKAKNETELGELLYGHQKFDERVGFYSSVMAGNVLDGENRINSSSGGLTTWFSKKLMENDEIDAVIHVGESAYDKLFSYRISNSIEELSEKNNKKSRYYPVTYSDIIEKVQRSEKRFLFIGIPCFVKSIRLLQSVGYLKNIVFTTSLLCGHMKSSLFAENLSWQSGIKPKNLKSIDFRVKEGSVKANEYSIDVIDSSDYKVRVKNSNLLGSNWGHGFFKHKACDFCDDIAGECADVTFGDAWLPKYMSDVMGTNVIISRLPLFDEYIQRYNEELNIDKLNLEEFVQTQAGNFRHRREGIQIRKEFVKGWKPKKRTFQYNTKISNKRKKLYIQRYKLAILSTSVFRRAKEIGSYNYFKLIMFPHIIKYEFINRGFKGGLKYLIKKLLMKKQ